LQSDFSVGKTTAPICKTISPPDKWFCKFVWWSANLQNDFSDGKMTAHIYKMTFPPEK